MYIKFITSILLLISIATAQSVVEWYTSMGNFKCQLREDLVPMTVGKFVDKVHEKYHDGSRFNRVVSGFVIQAGINNGSVALFPDEFHPSLNHNRRGILSMGNEGPNTNAVEYFITLDSYPHLNNLHSVFGEVTENLAVVLAIGRVPTASDDEPLTEVRIDSIRIISGMIPIKKKKNTNLTWRLNERVIDLLGEGSKSITSGIIFNLRNERLEELKLIDGKFLISTKINPGIKVILFREIDYRIKILLK